VTTFVLGPTRAHVVRWRDDGKGYDTIRSRYKHRYHGTDYGNRKWPVRYSGISDRPLPWCPDCVNQIRREVDMATEHVLEPAGRES
jgi:hypothetical protein